MQVLNTKEKLLKIGKEEFLCKGFKDASLREISKKAGYTLGAFYGYYPSKEALFDAIVAGPADALYQYYDDSHKRFAALPDEAQAHSWDSSTEGAMQEFIAHIYNNYEVFKLVFFRSAGTRYEQYLQKFIDLEVASTQKFLQVLRTQGNAVDVDAELVHILSSAMLSGLVEVVSHDMPQEKAQKYITQIRDFYASGWHNLLDPH